MAKGTDEFKSIIQQELNERASNDPLFAKFMSNENKNIDECIAYVINTVKSSGKSGFTDSEVFGMAMHYYDESDIKVGKPESVRIVTNKEAVKKEGKKQPSTKPKNEASIQGSLF